MYIDLEIPPGVVKRGTARQSRGRWVDSNLVRSPNGAELRPWGGWVQRGATAVTGAARAILPWKTNAGVRWIGIGTHSKLYVQSVTGTLSDITPVGYTVGRADAAAAGGFGDGPYGVDAYGTPRSDTENIQAATVWCLSAWGEWLLGNTAEDGKLYLWKGDPATPAQVVTNAPTGITGSSVDKKGFIYAYTGRTVSWCDQEAETVWAAAAGNQAGDISLNTEGRFLFGHAVPGAHLHFSDVDVWRSTYQGAQVVFGFEQVGEDCPPVSTGSVVGFGSQAAWMGDKTFFIYNGGSVDELPSDVGDAVFSDFNLVQRSKVTGEHNPQNGEIIWQYASAESIEIDSYALWSYRNNHWYCGKLIRTCSVGPGVFRYPIKIDAAGKIWEHEQGFDYNGEGTPFALSAPLEWPSDSGMAQGDKRVQVSGFIGDEKTQGDVQLTFVASEFPNGTPSTYGPYAITTAPVDLMFTARQIAVRLDFTGMDDARAGIFRLDAQPISAR